MTDTSPELVEICARAICFHGEYIDNDPDGPDTLTCLQCKGPEDCADWKIYSMGYERMAIAALSAALPILREQVLRDYLRWLNVKGVYGMAVVDFAKERYGLDLDGER